MNDEEKRAMNDQFAENQRLTKLNKDMSAERFKLLSRVEELERTQQQLSKKAGFADEIHALAIKAVMGVEGQYLRLVVAMEELGAVRSASAARKIAKTALARERTLTGDAAESLHVEHARYVAEIEEKVGALRAEVKKLRKEAK